MHYPPDLSAFRTTRHSPAFATLAPLSESRGCKLVDYCVPVNPYFPTSGMFASYRDRLEEILKYYPEQNESIAEVLAELLGLPATQLVVANGSTELITWIDHLLVRESLAVPVPTFGRWTDQSIENGKRVVPFALRAENDFAFPVGEFVDTVRAQGARVAAVCNPNNPTGGAISRAELEELCTALADLDLVVVDESFIEFVTRDELPTLQGEVERFRNLVVLKSLGKNFGLHGVRFGLAVAHDALAAHLRRALPRWNINALAEVIIRDLAAHRSEYERSRRQVIADREYLVNELASLPGCRVFPSQANFVYLQIPADVDGEELRDRLLLEHGFLVRNCGNKLGSDTSYFRIAANPRSRTDALVRALVSQLVRREVERRAAR